MLLKDNVPFKNLGSDYYTKFNVEAKAKYYIKKLQESRDIKPFNIS